MAKRKGRQKETRNANRMGGTSTRPDGRVDAYLTIDTPTGPHRMRTTKATQELADAWLLEARYLASRGAFAGFAYDSEDLAVAEFAGRWQALQDRAGLKRVHLYALRHTASMLLGRSGTDLKTTQGLMGHADARTTLKIYTHFEEEWTREAVSRLDGCLGDISGAK